jgi:hypothetical protein
VNEKGDEWLDSVEETSERHSTHKKKEERTEEEPRLSLGLYTYICMKLQIRKLYLEI